MHTTVRPLDSATFDEQVRSAGRAVVVDVWAEWCPPCRTLEPELAAVAEELADTVEIRSLDQDAHPEIGRRYGVQSLPTLLVFREGELIGSLVGARGRASLREELARILE
ncbi:MAG: thioredoxin family protein [Microthrixaceae bacterium]